MNIVLYKNHAPVNKRVKTSTGDNPDLTDAVTITQATFLTENDRKTPVFRVVSATDLTQYNYCTIGAYSDRQYFCSVINTAQGVYTVACKCDVLSSVATELETLSCTVKKSAASGSPYLYDDLYKTQVYKLWAAKEFPDGLTSESFILMTVGNKITP